jgi:phytoene dehydrogenase-like protein
MPAQVDAIVVGSGPNGLAGAITLARAGLAVRVYERASTVGGGTRSAELTLPGFRHDVCSAAHPLAVASPFMRSVDLAAHGLRLRHSEFPFAHPLDDGRAGVVHRDVSATAAGLGESGPAYERIMKPLVDNWQELVDQVLGPLRPPVPLRRWPVLAHFALHSARPAQWISRGFADDRAGAIIAGSSAHTMLPLWTLPTGPFGMLLALLAHAVGWPVVEGGSQGIADALVAELESLGGEVVVDAEITDLRELPPAEIVLLDVAPAALPGLAGDRLPPSYERWLRLYKYGSALCKIDYALAGPIPWTNEEVRRAATLHLGGTWQEIAASKRDTAAGRHPERPYVLAVQPSIADPTRAPAGNETLWAYCHVPAGSTVDMSRQMDAQIERFAPGFGDLVLARRVATAADVEAENPNYVGGDISAGATTVRQLLFRPTPQWDPYPTPIPGTYLCSSATPPGPGVHGMSGYHAARSALRRELGVRLV